MKNILKITAHFYIQGRGLVAVGTLGSGELKTGMTAMIDGTEKKILGMEAYNKTFDEFSEIGADVGVLLGGVGAMGTITPGEYEFISASS